MFEQRSGLFRRRQLHAGGALDHAHDDARSNPMARDICEVADPTSIVLKYVDQVAAYLAARQRASAKVKIIRSSINGRDENVVNLGSQRHLRVHPEIASALGNRDINEAYVADGYGKYYCHAIEGQPTLQPGDLGCAHLAWLGQVLKQVT